MEPTTIELWQHENGSLYAVEIDNDGRIVRASDSLGDDDTIKLAMNGDFDNAHDLEWFTFYSHQFARLNW